MAFLAALTDLMAAGVNALGYPGIFLFMFIEGVFTPIPSMVVLPFAGALAAQGQMSVPVIVLVASVAAMLGSGGAYSIGYRFGRPFVLKLGKYLFLDESDLDRAERWFARWGTFGVFLAMSVPGARSVVAYPAGAGRMPFLPFLAATFGGAMIWNTVLTMSGWLLFEEWRRLVDTFELIDLVALLVVLAAIGGYVYYKKRTAAGTALAGD
ncbi:MAG: DedA family protein [Euryarchaeota archaeon]|nr:DedA family protein [Euryarchaeota archaeon]